MFTIEESIRLARQLRFGATNEVIGLAGSESWTVRPMASERAERLRYSQLVLGIDTLLHSER